MDPNTLYTDMTTAMEAGKHVTARLLALELWHWLSTGDAYPHALSHAHVDAMLRSVMLSTEYLETYEDWEEDEEEDDDEDTGKTQLELF